MLRVTRFPFVVTLGLAFIAFVVSLQAAPPAANAGPDQTGVAIGSTVTLNGSGSSDSAGRPLTYAWKFETKPAGSAAALSGATTASPTFVADKNGTYVVALTVAAGGEKATDSVSITTQNTAPTANAGADKGAQIGKKFKLLGSGTDPEADKLTAQWTMVSQPDNSRATFLTPTKMSTVLVLDRPGTYVAQLQVTDPFGLSGTDTVEITHINSAPVANGGPDQNVPVGATVTLDAGSSTDVDEDQLAYSWTLVKPKGSSAVLSDASALRPTFTADLAGTYTASLVANDGTVSSKADKVVVTTTGVNGQPAANAGPDQRVVVGSTVHLDGTLSTDPAGDALSYAWTLTKRPAGSAAALSSSTTSRPTFVADVAGAYTASLVVTDAALKASLADLVVVSTLNVGPVANAGVDQVAAVGSPVQLRGSASSDVNGDELAFGWALVHKPAGSALTLPEPEAVFPEKGTVNPTFVPDVAGDYQFQLIVNDGFLNSAPDTVVISTGNSRPLANAGPDQTVAVGAAVSLNGGGSTDPNGDALQFSWTLVGRPAGSAATLSNPTTPTPGFTAGVAGDYVVQLRVTDGTLTSAPDTIVVSTSNSRPVANAGPDQSVTGGVVTLNAGGSSDADGSTLSRRWSFIARPDGSAAVLSSATAMSPTFTADVAGTYVVQLIVNDGAFDSAPSSVVVLAGGNNPPVANAGPDQSVTVGTLVTLNGSASSDPDAGDSITYAWTLSKPAGSAASLAGATTAHPTFTPDVAGTYGAALTVTDTHGATDSDDVAVTATPPPVSLTLTPETLGILTSSTGNLTVTLPSAAPAGGVTVTLGSSDTAKATVPASVTVAGGATSASITVTSGTNAGNTTITASAAGYGSDTSLVTVSKRTMSLSMDSGLVGTGRDVNGTLTLTDPAPAGGVSVTLTSSNTSVATVSPSPVTIAAGSTTASFTVHGVTAGSPTITASATGYDNATVGVIVTSSVINLADGLVVAPSQTLDIALSLSTPAPAGGVTISLSSSDTSKATVTPTVFIAAGASSPATNPHVTGVNVGTVTISASGPGYAPDSTSVNVTLTMTFTPASLSVVETTTRNITLNISAPAPAGFTVNLSTDDTSKATVPGTVSFTTGATSASVPVSGVAVGSTTLHASRTGVSSATASITVTEAPAMTMSGSIIGKDLQYSTSVSLAAAAPAGNLTITVTSADPARVLLSNTPTGPASGSITVVASAGSFGSPSFYVNSLVDSGTTNVTATATGYKPVTAVTTHYPSGFVHLQPTTITTTSLSDNTPITVYAAILNPSSFTVYTWGYNLRSGVTANVPVTSSNTAVGTITTSPVSIAAGTYTGSTAFNPASAGTSTITVGVPSGFATPSETFRREITATVTAPHINFSGGATAIGGKNIQTYTDLSFDATPSGPVDVTISSADASKITLGTSSAVDGGGTVTFTGVTTTSIGRLYINSRDTTTTAVTLSATAPGYTGDTLDVSVYPAGFITFTGDFTTTTFSANTGFNVYAAILSPSTLTLYTYGYPLRPGVTANVPVTSSNTGVGTVTTSPLSFTTAAGYTLATAFDPVGPGTTTVSIGAPSGFSTPASNQHFDVTVTAPNIYFGGASAIGGKGIETFADVYLDAAPPSGSSVDVTITSPDATKVTLGRTSGTDEGASVTITGVTGTYVGRIYIDGRDTTVSSVTLTASGTGYNGDTLPVDVYPSGFITFQGNFPTTTFSTNTAFNVYPAILAPGTLAFYTYGYPLRPGVTANVPVTSSNTAVGTITTSPLSFTTASGYTLSTQFDPVGGGTTTVSIGTPAGFSTPASNRQFDVTVNAPKVLFSPSSSAIVGKDQQIAVTVYLEAAPPSAVNVTVTSSSSGILTLSTDPLLAGSASVTFTGVTSTTVGTIYVQGRSLSTATVSGAAAGYDTGTLSTSVYPSGFITFQGNFTTSVGAGDTGLYVYAAVLDPATLNYYTTGTVRGGLTVSVPMSTSPSSVGTMTINPMSFGPNTQYVLNNFHPAAAGTTVVSVEVPPTFSMPSNLRQFTVTVNP